MKIQGQVVTDFSASWGFQARKWWFQDLQSFAINIGERKDEILPFFSDEVYGFSFSKDGSLHCLLGTVTEYTMQAHTHTHTQDS